ncbi:MAG: radical SAM protein [Spirochaetes bacterium]|nr:radical SAM protein [Spirochaetota bacterium]MBU0955047.1 radical SAM protein [Spirochaetota bacterium]
MALRPFFNSKSAVLDQAERRLAWIPDFWKALSPYAYIRPEDQVLILPPNLVYKTNASGAGLVQFLEKGGRFRDLPGFSAERAAQIDAFFLDIKAAYEGRGPQLGSLAYDFDFTTLPVLGEIAVTYRCNNRCRFCYAGCNDDCVSAQMQTPELDTAGFKRIIDIFRDQAKIPFFSFTGGEPLLRDDLETLIQHAISRGLRVNLVSNGTLASPERAASLYQAGLRTAQISIEAADAGLHDQLCGMPGSHAATVDGIRNLLAAGIRVQTNSTLTALNRNALLELPAFVQSLGIDRMAMNLFIPAGTGLTDQQLLVPYTETGAFVEAARKAVRSRGMEFFWYSPTPLCMFNPIAAGLGNKSCAACDGLISVAPDGGVLPCSSWPEPVGNLLTDGFSAVWFSEKARWLKHKEYAPEACKACDSFVACQAACPLYWKVCGYGELERSTHPAWQKRKIYSGKEENTQP